MAAVRLYGNLSRFGNKFKIEVADAKEAIRLLSSQIKGFKKQLKTGFYRVRIKRADMTNDTLDQGFSQKLTAKDVIHIIPVIAGAKSGGLSSVFNVVAGAAMLGAAFFTGGIALGVAGASMLLGGVAGLLTPTPETNQEEQLKESTSFSSLDNHAPQGRPVPIVYGEMMIGSLVIGQGLTTKDVKI